MKKYEVIIARSAERDFKRLDARWRSSLKNAMEKHLLLSPMQESKSKIKRLRGLRQPQYRLRVSEMRIYYDVNVEEKRVEVLGFVTKPKSEQWLRKHGVPE